MQIKLNKSGKPIIAKPELPKPAAVNSENKTAAAVHMDELKPETAKFEELKKDTAQTPQKPVEAVPPKSPKPMGIRIEDTLKKFIGQQIRVYMADHEYVSGRLDLVEDGWIKLCNARSAGSDYYFDEDVINTSNIVRVRVSVTVEKSDYVDFMNGMNK